MCCKSFMKRVVPFFLTFVVGLFIASLFITVAVPSFSFGKRGWKKHREYDVKMERENQSLKLENSRLERKVADLEKNTNLTETFELRNMDFDVPPPPLAPIPPARMR